MTSPDNCDVNVCTRQCIGADGRLKPQNDVWMFGQKSNQAWRKPTRPEVGADPNDDLRRRAASQRPGGIVDLIQYPPGCSPKFVAGFGQLDRRPGAIE
jgi:hypothetical protein